MMFQQSQKEQKTSQAKNILVLGKTGSGKSYFSNLLLQLNPQKENMKFQVYHKLESGTQVCQAEINQCVRYGKYEDETVTLNIIDTPGIFDTKDDPLQIYQYNNRPQSILNIENVDKVSEQEPFNHKFHKILLIFSATEKFDRHQQALLEELKIMVGWLNYVSIIITKCQQKQDEYETDDVNIENLALYCITVQNYFQKYDIYDIYFLPNKPISYYYDDKSQIGEFYRHQWENLYESIKHSSQQNIRVWSPLSILEKNKIGSFFNYRIGLTEEQSKKEHDAKVIQLEQQMKNDQINHEQKLNNLQKGYNQQQQYQQQRYYDEQQRVRDQFEQKREENRENYRNAGIQEQEYQDNRFQQERKRLENRYGFSYNEFRNDFFFK